MAAPAEQYDSWLDRAKKEEWSASRLRKEIKQATTATSDQTNRAANEDDQSISNEVDPEKSAAHQKGENAAAYGGETEDQAELESIESEAAVATENNTIDATTPIATAATAKRSTKKSLLEAWEGPSEDHEVIRELAIEEYFERANATDVLERIKKRSDLCKAVRECIETPIKQKLEDARAELNQTRVKLDETRAEVKKLKSNKSVNATAMAERDRNGVHTFRSSRRVAG
jgi:hypothetical protein